MTVNIKGDKTQTNLDLGVQGEVKTFTEANKVYIAMMAMKTGFVVDAPAEAAAAAKDSSLTITPTGQKANIAGHDAEEYLVHTAKADVHIWASAGFPKSICTSFHRAMSAQPGKDSRQTEAFRQLAEKGLFPVRVIVKSGEETDLTMEFVKYEEKKLEDSIFDLPKGIKFNPMPKMPGGGM